MNRYFKEMWSGVRLIAGAMLFVGHAAAQESAGQPPGTLDCESIAIVGGGCYLSVAPGVEVGAVRAQKADDGARIAARFTKFGDLPATRIRHKSQAIILIDDTTNAQDSGGPAGARGATLEQIKTATKALARTLDDDTEVALLFYDREVRTVLNFGASDAAIDGKLDDLTFEGTTTRTFGALKAAVDALANRPALTRSVYLFTDGVAEDVISRDEVIAAARAANVSISTYLVHWRRVGAIERGEAETVFDLAAKETGGAFAASNAGPAVSINRDFGADVAAQRDAGGVVTVDGKHGDVAIEVDLVRAGVGARKDVSKVTDTLATGERAKPTSKPLQISKEIWEEDWFIPAVIAALALLLLIVLLLLRRRRRNAEEVDDLIDEKLDGFDDDETGEDEGEFTGDEGETRRVDAPTPVGPLLAQLVMKKDGAVMDVREKKFSVGRSDENEVVIDDDSVSRIHCEFHFTREGDFAVTDLKSLNKTYVNDVEVQTQVLNDGDLIRLGEVEFSFKSVVA